MKETWKGGALVEKLIKEKDDGTTQTVENPKRGYYPVKERKRWDVTPEEYKKQKV